MAAKKSYNIQQHGTSLHDRTTSLLQLLEQYLEDLFGRVVALLLLLLVAMLLLMATRVLTLPAVRLLLLLSAVRVATMLRRGLCGQGWVVRAAALEVDVDPAGVLLGRVLQAELAAHLLDAGLDLLDVVDRVVPLAHDDMQVRLAVLLGVADALLEHVLGLLDELPVEVDRVVGHAARRVVLPEDVVRGLLVVLVHLGRVPLALVAQLLGLGAVAALVGLVGLSRRRILLAKFSGRFGREEKKAGKLKGRRG